MRRAVVLRQMAVNAQTSETRLWLQTDRPGERMALSLPLPGVRVLSVQGSNRHCTELHEAHTLCLLHAEQPGIGAEWRCGHSPMVQSSSGHVMVMELGEFHRTTRVHGTVSFSVVQIDPVVVRHMLEELDVGTTPGIRARTISNAALRNAVTRFVASAAADAETLQIECRFWELVRAWLELCGDRAIRFDPVVHRGIRRARDAIRDHFSSAEASSALPRLQELAALSGLSSARFSHAFKHWLGVSPHVYANAHRLNAGRRMLERGLYATQVAAALGFSDLPHFSRHFRRQFGLSPGAWLKLGRSDRAAA
jgi:AraC-like DNA-binding protein